jgi:predicted nucleotidyltransferase component of viral defense system
MPLDIAQHKNTLIRILKDVYTDPTLGPLLGFKGGTAAFFFYELDRFSVDLDFDLLDNSQEEFVFEQMKNILTNYGTIKDIQNKRYTIFFLLSYTNKIQDGLNIKIEVNKRQFGSQYEIRSYLGISMKVMTKEDMFANKLVALYERAGKTNRDIYDICFFFKNNWPLNQKIIEKRTNLSYGKFLEKCLAILEKVSSSHILSGIGELLEEKQKAWVKSSLKKETIFLLDLARENEKRIHRGISLS